MKKLAICIAAAFAIAASGAFAQASNQPATADGTGPAPSATAPTPLQIVYWAPAYVPYCYANGTPIPCYLVTPPLPVESLAQPVAQPTTLNGPVSSIPFEVDCELECKYTGEPIVPDDIKADN